jgi:D-galactose 1-dehydrogenase
MVLRVPGREQAHALRLSEAIEVCDLCQADGPLTASLDWRRTEGEEWTIEVEAADGTHVRLESGGARLLLNGEASPDSGLGEYPDLYRTFVDLIDERRSLVDVAPLRLVADCLLVGGRRAVAAVNG